MHVLITGGAGFIGSHLAQLHVERGDTVTVIDNLSTGSLHNIKALLSHPRFLFIEMDLCACQDLVTLIEQVDRVYHLAAVLGMFRVLENPVMTITVNIHTTEYLLNIIKNVYKKPVVIIASSSEVYGNQIGPLDEEHGLLLESTLKNHSTYPIAKLCNESMALSYFHEFKVPCIIARIFNTIGLGQSSHYGMVVPRFIKQALKQEPITIFGDGSQKRSFCDVHDTAQILNQIGDIEALIGQIINVGHHQFITIKELAQTIKTLAGSSSELTYTPYEDVYHGGYIDIHERQIDPKKLLAYTQYTYRWNLTDTLNALIKHHAHEA